MGEVAGTPLSWIAVRFVFSGSPAMLAGRLERPSIIAPMCLKFIAG